MAKIYSGRSGYSALSDKKKGPRYTLPQSPGSNKSPVAGEKTTVRSGAKSSKTFITTSPSRGGQAYVAASKTNKKNSKGKK